MTSINFDGVRKIRLMPDFNMGAPVIAINFKEGQLRVSVDTFFKRMEKWSNEIMANNAYWDEANKTWRNAAGVPVENPADLVRRQIDGEDLSDNILELTPEMEARGVGPDGIFDGISPATSPRGFVKDFDVPEFEQELVKLINRHSLENHANLPDFMIARYMVESYWTAVKLVNRKADWNDDGAESLTWAGTGARQEDQIFPSPDAPDEFPASAPVESNFGFYIDGYTLMGTDTVGEVKAVRYDGATIILKSKALTDFIDRRLEE